MAEKRVLHTSMGTVWVNNSDEPEVLHAYHLKRLIITTMTSGTASRQYFVNHYDKKQSKCGICYANDKKK
jgi:hypothetical protein